MKKRKKLKKWVYNLLAVNVIVCMIVAIVGWCIDINGTIQVYALGFMLLNQAIYAIDDMSQERYKRKSL